MRENRLPVWVGIFLLALLTASAFFGGFPPIANSAQSELPRTMVMATNPQGSIQYNLGVGIAKLIGKYTPMRAEIAPMGGGGYFPMFETKEVDIAIQTVDEAWTAYAGEGQFKKITKGKGYNIRTLLVGGALRLAPMVRGNSGLHQIKDLKGKRYAQMKMIYASTLAAAAQLANGGLTWNDVIPVPVTSLIAQNDALLEGRVDANSAGIGGAQTQRLLSAGCYILPLDPSEPALARMKKLFPGYGLAKVPPKLTGLKKPAFVMTKPFLLLARPGLPQNVTDAVLDTLWNHRDELVPVHPMFRSWVTKNFASTSTMTPYLDEAVNWYKAKGVWTDKMEKHQLKIAK